ncbi:MAG TPA: helicase-related protein, partial [Nitrolancea sp.]|nr:helicase-related protein [Nitrolancea sp.]
ANPQFRPRSDEPEIRVLIATDVLAEGLNMQDCDIVINYDLHWNPVRLIQRFGRIDRIGSENAHIWAFNFLPERGIESGLHLTEVLSQRIREIHETIGEDAAILDRSEQLNPEAMYAIYEGSGRQLSLFEEDELEPEYVDLNEAEEALRRLRIDDPDEFQRIADLRDGIRAGMRSTTVGRFVFCEAGTFKKLYLLDENGAVVGNDPGRVLAAIRATPETPGTPSLPRDYNAIVMRIKHEFADEVRHRHTQQEFTSTLTLSQRYILRELRLAFDQTSDPDTRQKITILEEAFRQTPTAAVRREIDRLRRAGVSGDHLVDDLLTIYQQHRLQDRVGADRQRTTRDDVPRIVCSMALV